MLFIVLENLVCSECLTLIGCKLKPNLLAEACWFPVSQADADGRRGAEQTAKYVAVICC